MYTHTDTTEATKVDDALQAMQNAGDYDEREERRLWAEGARKKFMEALYNLDDELQDRGLSTDEALADYPDPPGVHRRAMGMVARTLHNQGLIEASESVAITSREGCHNGIRRRWRLKHD